MIFMWQASARQKCIWNDKNHRCMFYDVIYDVFYDVYDVIDDVFYDVYDVYYDV